jgi:hypothetical protein
MGATYYQYSSPLLTQMVLCDGRYFTIATLTTTFQRINLITDHVFAYIEYLFLLQLPFLDVE